MPKLQLRDYVDPGGVETFVNIRLKDGGYQRIAATVDTGAAVSLFPSNLLETADYRLVGRGEITIEQAGIAKQSFSATEALVDLFLEDDNGHAQSISRRRSGLQIRTRHYLVSRTFSTEPSCTLTCATLEAGG